MYDDESQAKRQRMIESLAQADYLLFYSNRQYGTIPRLPERYPMTREYYRLLFSGELGYELVHWETSYAELYGLSFADNTFGRPELPTPGPLQDYEQSSISLNMGFADESFTVYDHPAVLIFKNSLPGTVLERQAFLDARLPQPGQPRAEFDTRLLLSAENARAQQEGGTWSRIFDRDSIFNRLPAVSWFVLVQVVFLLTLPITLMLFRWLPDRGYLLGKILGILLVAYIPWLLASLHWLSFSRGSIALGMAIIALASAGILRFKHREILDFLRDNKRLIVVGEALFLVSFLGLYAIRLWNPDLWHFFRGGEKPMDFAYFNAVVRSTYMPPYDPWFSGGYLNYYYFGQFMNATLTKFTGIVPAVAINMVVPLFFALTTAAAFSIVYNLSTLMGRRIREASGAAARLMPSPIWGGLIAAGFVAIIGNLDSIVQFSQGIGRVLTGGHFGAFDFWRSSRMMPPDPPGFEITEFPFFTFLFADPHAHLFVIPLTLLALGLGLAIILGAHTRYPLVGRMAVLPFLALGLTLGAILATNSWDAVTYAVVGAMALLIAEFSLRRRFDFPFVASSLAKIGALGALAALFFLPYLSNYRVPIRDGADSFVSSVPLLGGVADTFDNTFKSSETVTVLYQYMGIHGIFIVILFSFLAFELWRRYRPSLSAPEGTGTLGSHVKALFHAAVQTLGWRWLAYIGVSTVGIALLVATGYATVGFISGMLLLLAPLVLRELLVRDRAMPLRLFVYGVIALPLLLGILVDLFTFEGDIARLNTVFKFYLQAWVLFALASAYALWHLRFGEAIPWKRVRRGWQGFILLLVAVSLIYPVMATPARARDRFDTLPPSANGMTFMDTAVYSDKGAQLELRWDRQGIEWLQDNVEGSPVIVEGITPLYRWGNRISVYTGLPAVIGWDHHQKQQRGDYVGRNSGVDQRRREVNAFFNTPDTAAAKAFLDRYSVRYIYVGQMERVYYLEGGLAKFDSMLGDTLQLAYENPQVRIYQVTQGL